MTREEIQTQVLNIKSNNILCELPTGIGKSKIALEFLNDRLKNKFKPTILIVIPRLVLIDNWKDEFKKWGYEGYLPYVEFVTYVSFPKKAGNYTAIIYDEAHHLSERCREALESFTSTYSLLLSATVGRNLKYELKDCFSNLCSVHISARKAIQEEILPDPKVFLIPMYLNDTIKDQTIIKNKGKGNPITIPFSERFKYNSIKHNEIRIKCTQKEYYQDMSSFIDWAKSRMYNEIYKNMFLRKSGDRIKWLSNQKTDFVYHLLYNHLQDQRTLTFCNSILQTEVLGKYCINSKNKESMDNLEAFNIGKINHITACNMLDEGVNLSNCRIGIYASLNNSDRMIKQKLGRLLRHPKPILIIPYYVGTRDEELVNKMLEDYNPELVTKIQSTTQLKLD